MGNIFVKRNWQNDEKTITKMFFEINEQRDPIWLICYPEGSRKTPKKLEESQKFAKDRHLPVLTHVLTPRTKGFVATVTSLRKSHIKYVYDMTIHYSPTIPNIYDIFAHKLQGTKLTIDIKRFKISELPSNDSELTQWLYNRFQEKDKLIETLQQGDVPPQNSATPMVDFHIHRIYLLVFCVVVAFASLLYQIIFVQ
jgi:lysophosphatidic acid acyltransferase/lysophosphatidylinositol acyltransferase